MRFAVGQAFESAVSGRQAVVTETRDDGHAGHLRFLDNGLSTVLTIERR